MNKLFKIYDDSKNYTCQVIRLPTKIPVNGLDNLVEVNYQGNSVLISKDSDESKLYLFFPAECKLSDNFLRRNNLYRHSNLNSDNTKTGFFEDSGRVKAIKFKGVISSGFIIPIISLIGLDIGNFCLNVGDEFNEINGVEICRKYIKKIPGQKGFSNPKAKIIDEVVDSKLAPEHMDTAHLLRNTHRLDLDTKIVVSIKLHGTSARTYNTVVKRKLNWKERLARKLGIKVQEEEYNYVAASRRVVKSVGFEELPNKNHFFTSGDLWSEVAKSELEGKLNKGEAIYYEIIGKTYSGEAIQGGYTYGLDGPKIYVYRISNINPQGIEVDLTYEQMCSRARDLGVEVCPFLFKGTVGEFIEKYDKGQTYAEISEPLERIFYNQLLEKPSVLDSSVIEEGFCVRVDGYPKPEIYKIKSKQFLLHESKAADKGLADLEEDQNIVQDDANRESRQDGSTEE